MKKTMKRLLALLLVLCMLSAEFPASVFAVDSSSSSSTSTGSNSTGDTGSTVDTADTGVKIVYRYDAGLSQSKYVRSVTSYDQTNSFWHYYTDGGFASGDNRISIDTAYGIECWSSRGSWLALKINVPVDGTYTITQEYYKEYSNVAKDVGVYILSGDTAAADVAAALTDNNKVGSFDVDSAETKVSTSTTFDETKALTAGDYIVVYKVIASNASGGNYMGIGDLTLSSGTGAAVMNLESSVNKTDLRSTETVQIVNAVTLSDPASTQSAAMTYVSSNSAVVTVDSNGIVTGGDISGTASITVTATLNGSTVTDTLTFSVTALDKTDTKITYDFDTGLSHTTNVHTITEYSQTHGFWKYDSKHDGFTLVDGSNKNLQTHAWFGIQVRAISTNQWFALKINVPVAGDYKVTQGYATANNGGTADVFRVLCSDSVTDVAAALTDANKMGSLNFAETPYSMQSVREADFGYINFPEAGEYYLVYKRTGGSGSYMYIGEFTLNGGESLAVMEVTAAPARPEVKQGSTVATTYTMMMSDHSTSGAEISYRSLNTAVATVDGDGIITGVSAGTAVIEVTATTAVNSVKTTFEIKVNPINYSGYYAEYNFAKFHSYPQSVLELSDYSATHGFWAYHSTPLTSKNIFRINSFGIEVGSGKGSWVALKLNLPASGDYRVVQSYNTAGWLGIADVYLLPATVTDVAAALNSADIDYYKLGEINFYGATRQDKTIDFGVITAPAEECIIVYKAKDKDAASSGYYMHIGNLTFDGGDKLSIMEVGADVSVDYLSVGDSTQISASAYLSNITTDGVTLSYKSLTPAIASVDATGVVKGVGQGVARIEVTATYQGNGMSTVVEIPVGNSMNGYKLVYGYANLLTSGTDVKSVADYTATHNFWMFQAANATGTVQINEKYGIEAQNMGTDGYFAVKINVPVAGNYFVKQGYYPTAGNGAKVDVYVLPGSYTDFTNLPANKKVGSVDCYGFDGALKTANFGLVNFATAGEYIVVYKVSGAAAQSTGTNMYIGAFSLIGGSNLYVMDFVSTASRSTIKEYEIHKLTSTTYMSDGTVGTDAITYSSSNSAVATVNEKGAVCGVAPGTATITAKAGKYTKTFNFTVEVFNGSGYQVTYDYDKYHTWLDSRYVDEETIKNQVRNIDMDSTYNFWGYYADNRTDNIIRINSRFGIQAHAMGSAGWLALEINIPVAGEYLMTQEFYRISGDGAIIGAYILPFTDGMDNAAIEEALAQNEPVGTFDTYGTSGTDSEQLGFVTVPEAGKYLLVFKTEGTNPSGRGGTYFYIGATHLFGGEKTAIMNLQASVVKNTLKQGDSLQITSKVWLSDGSTPDIIYRYESLNTHAIVNRSGLITAITQGEAQIKVTAVTANDTKSATIPINVTVLDPAGTSYTYSMLAGFEYLDDVREITYLDTAGTWEYYADGDTGHTRSLKIHTSFGIWFQNAGNKHFVALKIRVPTAGDYMFTQTYAKYSAGGISGVYILPADTPADQILEAVKTATMVNEIDFFKSGSGYTLYKEQLGMVSFPEAGEYLVVYAPLRKATGEGAYGYYMQIGEIYLDGINCLKSVTPAEEQVTLNYGQTYKSDFTLRRLDGTVVDPADCTITFRSYAPSIATVDENGVVTATGHGTTTIEITAYDGVESHTGTYQVTAIDNTGISEAYIDMDSDMYVRETALVRLTVLLKSGNRIKLDTSAYDISVSDTSLLSVSEGAVTALANGTATIKTEGYFLGEKVSAELTVNITTHPGKTEPTYYTYEMRDNAMANILEYEEYRSTRNTTVASAKYYLRTVDIFYDLIPQEGLPRARQVGFTGDANYGVCRYCGCDVQGTYGTSGGGGWNVDPVNYPWKIQCKDCLRWFPSNDFGSFYALGLDESGKFDYYKAYEENEKLIASGQKGYLVNELYPEMGEGWGVDDGYGYRVYTDGTEMSMHIIRSADGTLNRVNTGNLDLENSACYIPLYMNLFWYKVRSVIRVFAEAYVYTGNIEYARAGAVLLDRVADGASDFDMKENLWFADYTNSCGGTQYGMWVGRIEDTQFLCDFGRACDAFFPALNDPQIIKYLSARAEQFGLENDKTTSQKIWENWKENILIECYVAANDGRNRSNYGQAEQAVAIAAIVLAEEPETSEILNWLWKINTSTDNRTVTGGDLSAALFYSVDRDGMGNEGAPNYNSTWVKTLYEVGDIMDMYTGDVQSPYEHPRFVNMFLNWDALLLSEKHTAYIGDTGSIAKMAIATNDKMYVAIWKQMKNTSLAKRIANAFYQAKKGDLSGISYGIYYEDPYSIQKEILSLVDKHGETNSQVLPGFGYSILRDGYMGDEDSLRSVWMYYGITYGHGDSDTLNIGIEAFGLDLSPEMGYPANTFNDPSSSWNSSTIAHNTVMVDNVNQNRDYNVQSPYLQDDSDYVSVMGVETEDVYYQCEEYKRTVVMVKVDDDNSYIVDFFRVLGGYTHAYSFHAQSQGVMPLNGLDVEMQLDENGSFIGTLAGPDIEKGESGSFPSSYNWLTKVRQDTDLDGNQFTVNFAITDYGNTISNNSNVNLKMTQITNFIPDRVAIAGGHVPVKTDHAQILEETDTLEYVITERQSADGEKLDSMFMTVFEPYRGSEYLSKIEEIDVEVVSGTPGKTDVAKAVKITHKTGRVDYVFYSSNNAVTYRVDDMFDVRGYVGVYSVDGNKGIEIYRYVTGGDIIVEATEEVGNYTGRVVGYSTELTLFDNYIDVDLQLDTEACAALAGRYINIENDGVENAFYQIVSAKPIDGGVRINLGTDSVIREFIDATDADSGYNYNIAKGQRFSIQMSYTHTDLSTNNRLMFLELVGAKLTPSYDPDVQDYTCFVGETVRAIGVRAFAADPNATVKIQIGNTIYKENEVDDISISKGSNLIQVTVIAEDGMTCKTYYITVYRASHFCYGGEATCQERAVCESCGSHYGYIDPSNHTQVELWNGKYATKETDGYSGDYYCVDCHLLAQKGHVLTYQVPGPNWVMVLLIAAGVLLVGGAATVVTILVIKKKRSLNSENEGIDSISETPESTEN